MAPANLVAKERLTPYLDRLSECIDLGWTDFERECGHIRHKTSPRTRACIVHDNIVTHARRIFESEKRVLLYERNGTLMLQIDEMFLLRFKKLDEDKLSKGIDTQERIDFLDQAELPGVHRGTNIIAGYELNILQTGIKEISITCPNGKQNAWTFELNRFGADVFSIHTPPMSETEDNSTQIRTKKNYSSKKVEKSNG
jgi:hypothetical protein